MSKKNAAFVPMTEDQIRAAIIKIANAKIASGMDPEKAVEEAGAEFRAARQRQGDLAIAAVEQFFGVTNH